MLDTNILISALISPDGLEARVVSLALEGKLTACVSLELWAEYSDVLGRKKFARYAVKAAGLLDKLAACVTYFTPTERVAAAGDPDDNLLLECAMAAEAKYLVTGNVRDFPFAWRGTRTVTARTLLNDHGWL